LVICAEGVEYFHSKMLRQRIVLLEALRYYTFSTDLTSMQCNILKMKNSSVVTILVLCTF